MSEPPSTPERTTQTPPSDESAARSPDSTAGAAPASRGSADVPSRVGRYEVRERLGAGAFGCVYRAFDPELKREVAIKVPRKDALTPELRERFLREAHAAAAIHHPNVCPIYDVGTDGDLPFMVMRFVPGGTLDGVLKRRKKPFEARESAVIVRKIALGVAAAHAKGVLHRDLKPANALWDDVEREVLVTDFGLARVSGEVQLSQTGQILGTPAYMSPEQARARPDEVGPLTDVYSLGVILYRLTTGRMPFEGSLHEVLGQVIFAVPRPPSEVRPGLDPWVDALCTTAMAKAVDKRYESAKAFADALADFIRAPDRVGTTKPTAPTAASSWQELGADPRPARRAKKVPVFTYLCLLAAGALAVGGVAALVVLRPKLEPDAQSAKTARPKGDNTTAGGPFRGGGADHAKKGTSKGDGVTPVPVVTDPFQANSKWVGNFTARAGGTQRPGGRFELTVLTRTNAAFTARVKLGDNVEFDAIGTINDGNVAWKGGDIINGKSRLGPLPRHDYTGQLKENRLVLTFSGVTAGDNKTPVSGGVDASLMIAP
jgi:tRNA A-37 threonylcarbamoyl transferase component Bud32